MQLDLGVEGGGLLIREIRIGMGILWTFVGSMYFPEFFCTSQRAVETQRVEGPRFCVPAGAFYGRSLVAAAAAVVVVGIVVAALFPKP